jgi:ABC-2 type transport system ATP-binding protein
MAARSPTRETCPFVGYVLEARGLVKRFKDVVAVAGVDVTVAPGERVGLLGPNGAGKTTTLLMLLGAITPDDGTIDVVGHRLPRGRHRAMESVGFAAGYLPLPDHLRVGEVLELFANLYGLQGRAATDAVEAGLARFRVPHLSDRRCVELSSGQRTLVGIVKAVLHKPRLLVLDEPTASLDPDVAQRVRTGLLDTCRIEGTAILVTSHNMLEVQRLCERVVFVSGGRVVADGAPEEIAAHYGHGDLEGVFLELAAAGRSGDDLGALDDPGPGGSGDGRGQEAS